MLPEKIRQLDVAIGAEPAGELLKHSVYEFRYRNTDIDTDRPAGGRAADAPHRPDLPGRRPLCRDGPEPPGRRPVPAPARAFSQAAAHADAPARADRVQRHRTARRAGIATPTFDLSHDGQMLLVDRFDVEPDGTRLGFEDVAALMGLRVRDIQSDRKCQGSYQRVAELLRYLQLDSESLARFFEQVAFSVMVRNGDGHLKNFGVLYSGLDDVRLAPMFDVVTTSIYRYTRYEGGPELEDRTLALKLFSGKHHTRAWADGMAHANSRSAGRR